MTSERVRCPEQEGDVEDEDEYDYELSFAELESNLRIFFAQLNFEGGR